MINFNAARIGLSALHLTLHPIGQSGLDEEIELAIEHACGVGGFHLGRADILPLDASTHIRETLEKTTASENK